MAEANDKIYEFKEFRLVTEDGTLWRGKERIPITQKTVELLTLLIEHRGRVVSRDHILERLWPDTYVDENNLSVTVSMLRKAFGESAENAKLIETIPRKGYRFIGDVNLSADDLLIAEREYTRAVIETTQVDDEMALHALSQLQTGSRRQTAILSVVVIGLVTLTAAVVWLYLSNSGPFASPSVYSVAVMPFQNMSAEETDRQMSHGLTDSLITKLSAVRGLSVRPMSAVSALSDKEMSAVAVGKELDVDAVLEGTIQRNGETYRISVQIVNAKDNQVIWANVIEQRSSQIFDFQRLIAAQVSDALAFKLSDQDRKRLTRLPTNNAEAYREYLLGRFFLNKRTSDDLKKAIPHFERSIELDPQYSDAFSSLAVVHMLMSDSGFGVTPPDQGYPKAIEYASKAIELDESSAEAFAVLGNVETGYRWNAIAGEKHLRQAIDLNPSLSSAHLWLGWNLIVQERSYEADDAFSRAADLDPTSLIIATDRGYPAFFAGDYGRATSQFRLALERDVNFIPARFNLWRSMFYSGDHSGASSELNSISTLVPADSPILLMARGCTFARTGKIAEARQLYTELKKRQRDGEYITPNFSATLAAELEESDDVLSDLEMLLRDKNDYAPYLKFAPEFRKYRSDPRFQSLVNHATLGASL